MEPWSESEINLLKNNINEPYEKLSILTPKRTIPAIIGKKDKLKLKRKSEIYWTKEQEKYLIENYHRTTIQILSKRFNKTYGSIYSKRIRLIKQGHKFKNKNEFFSKYWKKEYKTNRELKEKHKIAITKLWNNKGFRIKHKKSMENLFSNEDFFAQHKKKFLDRRNSKKFRRKQSKVASINMKLKHADPKTHKQLLANLRQNPSSQQVLVINYLREIFGEDSVGCNDWKILEGMREVDIPIYSIKTAIEWDGEYWHNSKVTKKRDQIKDKILIKKGWNLIRIVSPIRPFMKKERVLERADIAIGIIAENLFNKKESSTK